jgi:hypothetical protein
MIQSNDETMKLLEALEAYVKRSLRKANDKLANGSQNIHNSVARERADYVLEQIKIHKRAIDRGQLGWS